MKLCDIRDSNGSSLQSFAELLVDKCAEAGVTPLLIFIDKVKVGGKPDVGLMTTLMSHNIAKALRMLAGDIESQRPAPETKKVVEPS